MTIERPTESLSTSILHTLRIKGLASSAALAAALGVSEIKIDAALRDGEQRDIFSRRSGRTSRWRLTATGHQHWGEIHSKDLAGVDVSYLARRYDADFLRVNSKFKHLCTQWQLESDWDETLAGLIQIHATVDDHVTEFASQVSRFARYRTRLGNALRRFAAGDTSALLQPLSESYHDIWMEMHEDLLVLLDRQREPDD